MQRECYNHPGKNALATCCYCGRHLCQECLMKTKDYYRCRNEHDCLNYQNKETEIDFSPVIKDGYSLVDKYFNRLLEVQDELGEIGRLFEGSASRIGDQNNEEELTTQLAKELNKQRIMGFRAYHLSKEGLALLNLTAVTIAYLKTTQELDTREKLERIEKITSYAEELEPHFNQTFKEMSKYKSLDAKEIVEAMAAQISESRKD